MKVECNKCFWQDDWHNPNGSWCYMFKNKVLNCKKFVPKDKDKLRDPYYVTHTDTENLKTTQMCFRSLG